MTVCSSHLDTCRGAFSIISSMKCQPAQHSIKTLYDRHVGLLALYILWNKCVATPNTVCLLTVLQGSAITLLRVMLSCKSWRNNKTPEAVALCAMPMSLGPGRHRAPALTRQPPRPHTPARGSTVMFTVLPGSYVCTV
jgi:hypothetical protein